MPTIWEKWDTTLGYTITNIITVYNHFKKKKKKKKKDTKEKERRERWDLGHA